MECLLQILPVMRIQFAASLPQLRFHPPHRTIYQADYFHYLLLNRTPALLAGHFHLFMLRSRDFAAMAATSIAFRSLCTSL